jgi:uncharacterized protein YoxC
MDIKQSRNACKMPMLRHPLVSLLGILAIVATAVFGCSHAGTVPAPNQPSATTQNMSEQENQQLQQLYNLTHSSEYSNALAELSKVQGDSSQLATFVEGLPELPTLLQNVTIGEIQTAVDSAKQIRNQLSSLPPLPNLPLPPPPPGFPDIKGVAQTLEDTRQDILAITEPIAQLPDLPSFIQNTDSLEQAKQRIDSHLLEVKSVTTDTAGILQRLKTLSEKPNVRLAEFQSLCSSSDYQTLATRISQVNGTNSQLVTLVKSLPALPSTIANIPINKVEDAVNKAKKLNTILSALPPLPPLTDTMVTLETLRTSALKLTGILAKLPDLPQFISGSKNLEDVRVRTQNYLVEVQNATSHGSAMMQQVNQIATGSQLNVPVSKPQQATYNLSVSVNPQGGGWVSTSGGQYTAGTPVTITATPASNYVFDSWSGDFSGSSNTITITMNSSKNIVANFRYIPPAPVTYNLSVSVSPQGSGSVSSYGGQYTAGTSVTLTATPASGYIFGHWAGDASGSTPTITITMNSNKSVVAYFSPVATLPNVTINNVTMPTKVEVGVTFTYSVTVKNSGSSSVTVTLRGSSSATGEFLNETVAITAGGSTVITRQISCSTLGTRTISFRVLYGSSELDSWSGSLDVTVSSTPTAMSFTVGTGPFGYTKLTSYLVQGQRVDVSFTIAGGNNDIYVYAYDPSNAVVAGSKNNRYYTSGQFSFTASVSGSYSLYFDNTFSALTSKNVRVTITGGQWK